MCTPPFIHQQELESPNRCTVKLSRSLLEKDIFVLSMRNALLVRDMIHLVIPTKQIKCSKNHSAAIWLLP